MEILLERPPVARVADLLELARETFRDTYGQLNDPSDFAEYMGKNFTEAKFLEEMARPMSEFWWARPVGGGPPVAYFKVNKDRPHDAFELLKKTDGRLCELERIYVRPGMKGLGLGQKLVEKALAQARADGSDWLWLGVWERNPAAIGFYERQGFEVFGRHIFQIGADRQVDFLMRRPVG